MGFVKHILYDWCVENDRLDILNSWHYVKNKEKTPRNTAFASNKYAWWVCSKCGYEWKAKISNRTLNRRGCPLCARKVVVKGINDLLTTHPQLAKEWHPTLNGDLTPENVSAGHGKKVWWQCSLGHSYDATVAHRTASKNPTGCPVCYSGRQTSFAEQIIFYYVKKLFPDAINRFKADFLGQMELDIFIPSIKYGIEYDGKVWHKRDKIVREEKKYQLCKEQGIKLIRFREESTPLGSMTADYIWARNDLYTIGILELTLREVLRRLTFLKVGRFQYLVDVIVERDRYEILQFHNSIRKNSLLDDYPQIASEWHPEKNGNLYSNMFTKGSDHKVWWRCACCGLDYESTIAHRTAGTACPKCGREKVIASSLKPVAQIHLDSGEVIKIFSSISEASRSLNINGPNITSVCKGDRPNAGGYFWRYVDDQGEIVDSPSWFKDDSTDNQFSLFDDL